MYRANKWSCSGGPHHLPKNMKNKPRMNSPLPSGSETKMTGQQTPGSKIQQRMALLRAVTTPPVVREDTRPP